MCNREQEVELIFEKIFFKNTYSFEKKYKMSQEAQKHLDSLWIHMISDENCDFDLLCKFFLN